MAAIPIRLPPLPGEALDSWLEAYACLLHVAVRDIFALAGADWDRLASEAERPHKLWLYQLDEPDLAALSAVTGVPAATLAGMTLARHAGTGLAEVTAAPGLPRTPRWWRQLIGSRYCPRCLAANGGRWMLTWRIPWTFACPLHHVLLADTCPDCGRRHRRTRTGQPRQPGRCDLTGLPLPPPRPPRGGVMPCGSDPARAPVTTLPVGGHVLAAPAHRHHDRCAARLTRPGSGHGRPAAVPRRCPRRGTRGHLGPARAGSSPGRGRRGPKRARRPRTGPQPAGGDADTRAPAGPGHAQRRQLAPVTAFGVTIADIMLHGRPGDPDPVIAAWLAETEASRRKTAGPANMLAQWHQASPALRAALAPEPETPGTSQLRAFTRQGYGTRKIARITGCSERAIRQLLASAGLRQPAQHPRRGIDLPWLREQYQDWQRSLKDIAAETGIPVGTLAAAARTAGIPVRHGMNGHAHPLASLGAPGTFPPAVWNAFTRPHAEQRIRRLLALPGQPGLHHAARELGIRHAILASQLRQLEAVTGITLLRGGPDEMIILTADGEQFARDVRPVLEGLAQSPKTKGGNHRTSP